MSTMTYMQRKKRVEEGNKKIAGKLSQRGLGKVERSCTHEDN